MERVLRISYCWEAQPSLGHPYHFFHGSGNMVKKETVWVGWWNNKLWNAAFRANSCDTHEIIVVVIWTRWTSSTVGPDWYRRLGTMLLPRELLAVYGCWEKESLCFLWCGQWWIVHAVAAESSTPMPFQKV